MKPQPLFYEDRFLESWAGPIITNPSTAIVELVANCWDAYATKVDISWPDRSDDTGFVIADNGSGMTKNEFDDIWRVMSYNRVARHGTTATPPPDVNGLPRPVFGKNGKGRFATFCFSNEYIITSRKNGQMFSSRVYRTTENPLVLEELEFVSKGVVGHGTEIRTTGDKRKIFLPEEQLREIIGSRFLANPSFQVFVNGSRISFNDISNSCISEHEIDFEPNRKINIFHIDTLKADKTTKQHGIAWWVLNRAVGECKWRSSDYQRILDGRTSEAKRFTFIVQADFLNEANAIKEDWSWFHPENKTWQNVRTIAQDKIREIIHNTTQSERDAKRMAVIEKVGVSVNSLPLMSKERVESFIREVVDTCPNLGEQEIVQLSSILAKLEKAKSRYGLLEILHKADSNDLDALHEVLKDWTINMAKMVLDEIQNRLKLINELQLKIEINGVDEVHELQPLFEKGLWMFGAQFESIEFTSNKGMTAVIKELFGKKDVRGSRNRPDFVILPDNSVGFYSRSSYDEDYNENGVEHVVIVDLKTTKLSIGSKEKEQVWRYVKELKAKGQIGRSTKVDGFVLGDQIEPDEGGVRTEDDNHVKIIPLLYNTILTRAKKRLLNLDEKVKTAPFLLEQQDDLKKFIEPIPTKQQSILVDA